MVGYEVLFSVEEGSHLLNLSDYPLCRRGFQLLFQYNLLIKHLYKSQQAGIMFSLQYPLQKKLVSKTSSLFYILFKV